MISKAKQLDFFNKKCAVITDSLTDFCSTGDHEKIHKLRVEFKKIRALVSLIKECCKDSMIPREFTSAKVVYRRAGVVRDAFIADQYHRQLKSKSEKHDAVFLEMASVQFSGKNELHMNVLNDWAEQVRGEFKNIGNDCAMSYYRKLLKKLSESFEQAEPDNLHEDRKIIKRLMYLYPLLPEQVKDKLQLNIDYLSTLQEEIGKWHDALVAREFYIGMGNTEESKLKKLDRDIVSRLRSVSMLIENFNGKAVRP